MKEDFNVIISDCLLENMQIYTGIKNENMEDLGFLILTRNMDPVVDFAEPFIIKIYLLEQIGSEFHVEGEIKTFEFKIFESAMILLESLPTMSALELLLLIKELEEDTPVEKNVVYQ
ncbi:hypothetical protein [Sporosarcina sp. G11-34]|uniref:hypothetical protein n=1 Tax=Sporosarcina sp. G11-34 TaxID=2849605 RepID=UPI0022A9E2BE|nr:hypothetical protein [Sporosarcina sp. G11-34]MCZ2257196.1 hypothetical protein [Sporosarcina sp. G11-34]